MTLIAPNLSILLGAQLAAKLIGVDFTQNFSLFFFCFSRCRFNSVAVVVAAAAVVVARIDEARSERIRVQLTNAVPFAFLCTGVAGSLANLSKMPACNVQLLGQERRSLAGFSSSGTPTLPHTGLVFTADLVQRAHPDQQRRASRLVSTKCAIAARVDSFHEAQDGHIGMELLSQIESTIARWNEPPAVKLVKPLPAPGEAPRKKRGGRRYRKMKARNGLSELRKAKGRMLFGEVRQ